MFIKDQTHLNSLISRWYFDSDDENKLKQIDINDKNLIHKKIKLRSPIACESKHFHVCETCFGEKTPSSPNLGAAIGSYISESIIQTVLRTHHFSGAFITEIDKKLIHLVTKRFPKIGSKLFFNLSQILSQRLKETNYRKKDNNINATILSEH